MGGGGSKKSDAAFAKVMATQEIQYTAQHLNLTQQEVKTIW